jgi:hypothetical protein
MIPRYTEANCVGPIASYGRIWTSRNVHHAECRGAITSAATACATTARVDGGTSGARRASQPITGDSTSQVSHTSTWYASTRHRAWPCVIMLIQICSPHSRPTAVQNESVKRTRRRRG